MKVYCIGGGSGTGKTTVCEELKKRGYQVVDADEELAFFADPKTGLPVNEKTTHWLWDKEEFHAAIQKGENEPVFVCGGATNQDEFKDHFEKMFTLHADDAVLTHRLLTRTNNDFGKDPKDLEQQLEWNKNAIAYAKQRGSTLIDATRPLKEVVDEILSLL
jgi:broad-specificity NMP kinase